MKPSLFVLTMFAAPMALAVEAEHAETVTHWYSDPTTNTAFAAMVIFLLVAARMGAFKVITSGLDNRATGIQNQINEAKSLREEAAKLMADAKTKAREAEAAAQDIIKRAKADAATMMKQAQADLEAKVARREAQAEQRIARAESEATSDVRSAAADAATQAARDILSDSENSDSLFSKALKEIDGRLN